MPSKLKKTAVAVAALNPTAPVAPVAPTAPADDVFKNVDAATKLRIAELVAIGVRVSKDAESVKADVARIMSAQFPTKKACLNRKVYKPFMSALSKASNKGWAYRVARAWVKELCGGLPSADGTINTKDSGKGMTAGRWYSGLDTKFDSIIKYFDKLPADDKSDEIAEAIEAAKSTLTVMRAKFDKFANDGAADDARTGTNG